MLPCTAGLSEQPSFLNPEAEIMHDEHGDRLRVIYIQLRQCRIERLVSSNRYDVGIVGEQQRFAGCLAMDFQFGERLAFEAFHKDDIAGRELLKQLIERRLWRTAQFVHQHPTFPTADQNFGRPRFTMAIGVLPRTIYIEAMMSMLDYRDPQAFNDKDWNHPFQ